MKSGILLGMVALLVLAASPIASAQYFPDPGVADTVRLGCPELINPIVEGETFLIPVYVWNDEDVFGFTFPFKYDSDMIEIVDVDFTNSVFTVTQQAFVNKDSLPEQNQFLVGWADFTSFAPLTVTSGTEGVLVLNLKVKVLPGATPHVVDFDSLFFPPAGDWNLTVDTVPGFPPITSAGLQPQYADCGTRDVFLPVEEIDGPTLPESFSMSQNVPNPFNPNTFIDFAVPRSSQVTIEVYNALGQKVTTLVDEYTKAGFKRVEWNGTNTAGAEVASGIYFYKMSAGDFTASKKMMLLK